MQERLLRTAFKDTSEIKVSSSLVEQVIGQEKAVEIARKAAKQQRNMLLIGIPGTGKSMIAQALAEMLPAVKLQDIVVFENKDDSNTPKVKAMPAGTGRKFVEKEKEKAFQESLEEMRPQSNMMMVSFLIYLVSSVLLIYFKWFSDVITAAFLIIGALFLLIMVFVTALSSGMKLPIMRGGKESAPPKLLINNENQKKAPFIDGTGARAGSLLGDIKHDPYQCIPAGQMVILDNGQPIGVDEIIEPFYANDFSNGVIKELLIPVPLSVSNDTDFQFSNGFGAKAYKRHYDGDLISFKTALGTTFETTPNHPIAILSFSSKNVFVDYKRADEIKENDFLITPKRTNFLNEPLEDNPKLFGDILADAHVGFRSVLFKFAREFKIEKIKKDTGEAGLRTKIRKRKYTHIDINSTEFVKHLHDIGLIDSKKHKRVPACIFSSSKEKIMQFLSSFISLDGHVTKHGQFEILSSQKNLLLDIQALLLKFGIKAAYRPRLDTGFAKGKLQHRITWADYEWSKEYQKYTENPVHKENLRIYFSKTQSEHVAFHDEIPNFFEFLERIRTKYNLSKTKIHKEYYSLNQNVQSSKKLTSSQLNKILDHLLKLGVPASEFEVLKKLQDGDYSFDKVLSASKKDYSGYVYNFTTTSGNYLVNNILTHNSAGLGTPAHLRVEPGMIHRANGGVLYIDEVATLSPKSQQELLTAIQEKKYPITGQSEMSSGAMTHTEPVPCDFLLVASGNMNDLKNMHPALRSRIRGYGYEVYLNEYIDDTLANREKILQFVAQEIKKDGRVSPFTRDAVEEIILEARKRGGRKNKLTLKLRDLGGLIRAAGDIALTENSKLVERKHVVAAKKSAMTLEAQIADNYIELKKDYKIFNTKGFEVGKVNGLAVLGSDGAGGILLPIEAEIAPSQKKSGSIIATGKLGEIAKEAVTNVSALIKKYKGISISAFDIHIQFLQTYEGVEGDSASVSVATAVLSALERIPIKQEIAMTGSLSIKGEVLPVGGVTAKVEAAIEAGAKSVIVPDSNKEDIFLNADMKKKIKIIPAKTIVDVLQNALKDSDKKKQLIQNIKKAM